MQDTGIPAHQHATRVVTTHLRSCNLAHIGCICLGLFARMSAFRERTFR